MHGPAFFAYATNYMIDTQHAVILDVEATRAIRQAEVGASRTMLDRTAERFELKPQHLAADSAYGSAENPAFERSRHDRKKIEMLFAHLKHILRLARLRLRGPSGARDEFLLAATAQNLRRLAKLRPIPAFAGGRHDDAPPTLPNPAPQPGCRGEHIHPAVPKIAEQTVSARLNQ